MEFKERIKTLREEKNMTHTELGAMFNKSESAARAWELGRSKPDADTLIRLSSYFDCSTDYMLGISDYRNEDEKESTDDKVEGVQKILQCFSPDEQNQLAEILIDALNNYSRVKNLNELPAYKEKLHKKYLECMSVITKNTRSAFIEFECLPINKQTKDRQRLLAIQKGQRCEEAISSLYKAIDKEMANTPIATDENNPPEE